MSIMCAAGKWGTGGMGERRGEGFKGRINKDGGRNGIGADLCPPVEKDEGAAGGVVVESNWGRKKGKWK